jgi:hypothetical protein
MSDKWRDFFCALLIFSLGIPLMLGGVFGGFAASIWLASRLGLHEVWGPVGFMLIALIVGLSIGYPNRDRRLYP